MRAKPDSVGWRWLLPLSALVLLPLLTAALWTDSVDLAHHYALVARLAQHWTLPGTSDPSLGEMNVYPHLSHVMAALVGRVLGSPLLGLYASAQAALLLLWLALLGLVRAQPARTACYSAGLLGALLLLNRYALHAELHGAELVGNFFFSQLAGQTLVAVAALAALQLERRAAPPLWRFGLLAAAAYLCMAIHLLPALELLALLALLALSDVAETRATLRQRLRRGAPLLALVVVTGWLMWRHPGFAVMRSISGHNGNMPTAFLDSRAALAAYATLLAALSLLLWYGWRRHAQARQMLALKYVALLGLAIAALCLAQLGVLLLGSGSEYAIKKYVFGMHTMLLLQLCLLPALRRAPSTPAPVTPLQQLAWPLLLALATLGMLPPHAPAATATLVQAEQQLLQWRDLYQSGQPERATLVAGVPGLSPVSAYLLSIGTLAAPRNANAGIVLAGGLPDDLHEVATLITAPDNRYGAQLACRRPGSTARWVVLDGACLDLWQHPPGSRLGFRQSDDAPPCSIQGFSHAEAYGSWSIAPQASLRCPIPRLHGQRPRSIVLQTEAFLQRIGQQRLQLSVNGGAQQTTLYQTAAPQRIELVLPADGSSELTLRLALPDARSPATLGLGPDQRQLGILLQSLEFH
ncbi:MAG: hypothetical protein ACEQSK_07135 [Sphingomonadaceae bacterium]